MIRRVERGPPTGSLHTARIGNTATLLASGKVLVAGGSDGNNSLSSAELYDPASGTWSDTGSMGTGRSISHSDTSALRQSAGVGWAQSYHFLDQRGAV